MMSGSNTTPPTAPATEPRLRLKPAGPATGQVDGAWWPRTHDLAAELPPLLAEVAARLGRIDRVTYHLADWPEAHRRLIVAGGVVRLEGFRSQRAGSLTVIGWDRHRLTLQVIPSETEPARAQHALAAAADTGDTAHLRTAGGEVGVPLPA